MFQLPPTPGIHHGISVALLLSGFKNHTLPKVYWVHILLFDQNLSPFSLSGITHFWSSETFLISEYGSTFVQLKTYTYAVLGCNVREDYSVWSLCLFVHCCGILHYIHLILYLYKHHISHSYSEMALLIIIYLIRKFNTFLVVHELQINQLNIYWVLSIICLELS